ncbi:GGDEF domain-containing protein [Undibacterium sp. SXout11W]|uniref:GGDEF domain-containing protein n=1 Tax=Undibacterium sp. SXout11W TaxID=3413050 RepID=UPI003BEF9763
MESIIKHLVEITGYRDHDLLNISIASSLREIFVARSARVSELSSNATATFLTAKVDITSTGVDVIDQSEPMLLSDKLSDIAELKTAIAGQQPVIEYLINNDPCICLLLWNTGRLEALIELIHPTNRSLNTMEVVRGMLVVYKNFLALLDYNERDSLTGLLNRKTFDDSYTRMLRMNVGHLALAEDELGADQPETENKVDHYHWLAVVDIDYFKRVNDQFGHLYGDEVLILIANIMRNSFQPNDHLFRFGGEEFLILVHSSSLGEAHRVLDQFRTNVEQYHFPQVGQVTVSIGFARIDTFEPAVATVGRADQALYYAKTHGRNQTCHYDMLVANGDLHQEYSNDIAEFF